MTASLQALIHAIDALQDHDQKSRGHREPHRKALWPALSVWKMRAGATGATGATAKR
jgi:hypothetical protein